jgi:hypothetical protein
MTEVPDTAEIDVEVLVPHFRCVEESMTTVRHGNQNDIRKKVKIWFSFTADDARLIVEDEGGGFKNLEEWNDFYHKRMACFYKQDFDGMTDYVSYRTEDSTDDDGGNALFAAVEYWNDGVVYNERRNAVAVGKTFRDRNSVN